MSDLEFTATSGNHAVLKTVTIGNRSGCDATWDDDPSDRDIDECMEWYTQALANETGVTVHSLSIRESNPDTIGKIIRTHLGGGQG